MYVYEMKVWPFIFEANMTASASLRSGEVTNCLVYCWHSA